MEHFTLIMIIERYIFCYLLLFIYIFFFSHFKLFQKKILILIYFTWCTKITKSN